MSSRFLRASRRARATDILLGLFVLLLSAAVLLGMAADANTAPAPSDVPAEARPAGSEALLVQLNDMQAGSLLFRSKEPGKYVEAPRLLTDVNVTVTGPIARTVVTQRFENPGDGWVEGVYVFPLPETAAVDILKIQIGKRFIEGKIKPRAEARLIYEKAKAEGRKASLVEQQRPNLFTNAVANIGPGETIVVQIEFQQTVRQTDGEYRYRFPLVVAPRYNPEAPTAVHPVVDRPGAGVGEDPVPDRDKITAPVLHPDEGKINPVSIRLRLNAGFALGDVTSAYHQIALERNGDNEALVALADGTVPADKDFELSWRPKLGGLPQATLFRETVDGEDYMIALVTPPDVEQSTVKIAREVVFVIDTSGSMSGPSIRQARASLLLALERLKPGDRFNIIRFNNEHEAVFDAPVDVTRENLAIAKHFVSRLEAEGGTEMLTALNAALEDKTPDDKRLRQVIFLTDGAIGNEAQLFTAIAKSRGRSRVFTIGIGSAPNSHFMRRASELGRGTFTHIGAEEQVAKRMTGLFRKLERPVMRDFIAEWDTRLRVETWPEPIPDLYAGEPLLLVAKASSLRGKLKLKGQLDGKPWKVTLLLKDAREGLGVAKLWARQKIASLEARRNLSQGGQQVDAAIEKVALQHHLVSRMTSLVAVDVTPVRPAGEDLDSTKLPLNLPDGWDFEKVFGEQRAQQPMHRAGSGTRGRANFMAFNSARKLVASQPAPTPTLAKTKTVGVKLPQGSALSNSKLLIGAFAILFAGMLLLTFALWRHVLKLRIVDRSRQVRRAR